jgi:sensor histidine kinase YesM
MFHPVFRSGLGKIIFSVWWIAIIAIHSAILYFYYHFTIQISIVDSIVWNILFALVSLGLWYWVRISDFESQRPSTILINHLGAAIISILFIIYVHLYSLSYFYSSTQEYLTFLEIAIPGRAIIGVFYYVLITQIYYLIIYVGNFREKVTREAELKALVKDAELSWLKLQVNPHFLFNSLNSVSSLTMTSPERAQVMITRLSELLRYSLKQTPDSMVPLSDELDNCKKYLEIEKVRFGSRLNYSLIVSPGCLDVQVPSMLLQPLFENAIKHSVAQSPDESIVESEIYSNELGVIVKVSNTLPDFPTSSSGTGVGLENIRRRLILVYGVSNLLSIEKTATKFTVKIQIPTI